MDLKEIEKLMRALENSKISRLCIRQEGFEIELEKELAEPPMQMEGRPATYQVAAAPAALAPLPSTQEVSPAASEGEYITSPMVGSFYLTPSPGEPAMVKVGDEIEESSIVCIIEAMKVMNEVKAQIKGKIAEILVKNGDPVEFGTKIFRIV